jgi:Ca2+-transporting ATPase
MMITGDHPVTARAIAHRLGIADQHAPLLSGAELDGLSDAQLHDAVAHTRVYARVAPEQKIRIVEALQRRGDFVAMTGDGVNDAPALRRANIGVAMGKVGTDVAREASHMVLLDDNFATIVAAVQEGRRIFDNIRKFIRYIMTGNAGEIITLLMAPLLGLPIPLLPLHILWVNLVTDGLPGLALSGEPAERGIMQRPPRPPSEPVLSHGMGWQIVWVGLLIGGLTLGTQAWALHQQNPHWQTMVFMVLTFAQLFNALAMRSERQSLWQVGLASNRFMLGALLITAVMQLAVIYTPALQAVFNTDALSLADLTFCIGVSALVLPAVELEKWLARRGLLYREPPTSGAG